MDSFDATYVLLSTKASERLDVSTCEEGVTDLQRSEDTNQNCRSNISSRICVQNYVTTVLPDGKI